jgi:hypothetical protein
MPLVAAPCPPGVTVLRTSNNPILVRLATNPSRRENAQKML